MTEKTQVPFKKKKKYKRVYRMSILLIICLNLLPFLYKDQHTELEEAVHSRLQKKGYTHTHTHTIILFACDIKLFLACVICW